MTTTATVTIFFTDVVGSTTLRTGRGDVSAHKTLSAHFAVVRPHVAAHDGREVKTVGDSIMAAFPSARRAVECAIAAQRDLAQHNLAHPGDEVHIKIGINTGEAIREDDDLFGAAVDLARRIESKAAPDQILVSEIVRGIVGSGHGIEFVDRGTFRLKGFPEPWRLYETQWQTDSEAFRPIFLTFLFTDVIGWVAIAERLGERKEMELVRTHNAIVRAQLTAHAALWSKSMGDGFFAAFQSAEHALECAIAIQRGFAAYNNEHPKERLDVRIGLHAGEAIKEADDFYGRAVNLTARITSRAGPGEILVSSRVREVAGGSGAFRFADERELRLKGFRGSHHLQSLIW